MPRTVYEAFEVFLGRLVPTEAQRQAGASHRSSVKSTLEAKLAVNSFFESGSFTHATGVRGHSDIDVFVSLGGARPTSDTALRWVKDVLQARFPDTTIRISRPAVIVEFGGGYETWEVIPAFLPGRGTPSQLVYDIPGASSGWINSAPKEHLGYVNECDKKPNKGNAKALARFVKAWKYYCNVPVSSFYLEMRAAQHVAAETTYIHVWDVCLLLESLDGMALAAMNDPSGATGRIYACATDAQADDALSKLSTAAIRARKALDAHQAEDPINAFYYLDRLFGGNFPSRNG